jgi:hypothetical protein
MPTSARRLAFTTNSARALAHPSGRERGSSAEVPGRRPGSSLTLGARPSGAPCSTARERRSLVAAASPGLVRRGARRSSDARLVPAAATRRGRWLVAGAARVAAGATARIADRCRRDRRGERAHGKEQRSKALEPHGSPFSPRAAHPRTATAAANRATGSNIPPRAEMSMALRRSPTRAESAARRGEADRGRRRARRADLRGAPNRGCSRHTSGIAAADVTIAQVGRSPAQPSAIRVSGTHRVLPVAGRTVGTSSFCDGTLTLKQARRADSRTSERTGERDRAVSDPSAPLPFV